MNTMSMDMPSPVESYRNFSDEARYLSVLERAGF
jgi:hypothetical protein